MRTILIAAIFALVGCGGSQKAGSGEVFCDRYPEIYLPSCQQDCESLLEAGDVDGQKACLDKCLDDLRDDDTFSDSCPERLPLLGK